MSKNVNHCWFCGKEILKNSLRCRGCSSLVALKIAHSMPTTIKQKTARRKNMLKANKIGSKLPRSKLQIIANKNHGFRMGRLVKTEKQLFNFVSSWEDKFFNYISDEISEEFDIERQFYIERGGLHSFDFAIPELKLLIEIDGSYWHEKPGRKEKDLEIDRNARKQGYEVVRFRDADLKKLGLI